MLLSNIKQYPFYIQFTIKLLMIVLIGAVLILGQSLLVPLAFSIILSILLLPLTNFLKNKCWFSSALADTTAVLVALSLMVLLVWFLSIQIASFLNDIPSIKMHLLGHIDTVQLWLQNKFNFTETQQTSFIKGAATDAKSTGTELLGQTVLTITQTLFYIVIVAIYTLLILHYRHTIKRFLLAVFKQDYEKDVSEVLQQSKGIIQKYMVGLVIEMIIVAIANVSVLMLLGIKYAFFLGVFAAILNIIPYVGILTGMLFACLVTLSTSTNLMDVVWIIVSFYIIHFIDSNFLMTKIVGSKIKINALITIVGVVVGGLLIGLSGIFLALPVIAILKVIFDRIEDLKPWGMLLGDEKYEHGKMYNKMKMMRLKKAKLK